MNKVKELFGFSPFTSPAPNWAILAKEQACPFLKKKCIKVRKSAPDIAIGTCAVEYGPNDFVIICPHRLLERRQIFTDCLHLLTLHEPGNELHILPEITLPGGSVDYFLASVKDKKIRDFVGIEDHK